MDLSGLIVAAVAAVAFPWAAPAAPRPRPAADLRVLSVAPSAAALAPGDAATVAVRAGNAGRLRAPRSALHLLLSRDRRRDAWDVRIGTAVLRELARPRGRFLP